MEEKYFGNSVVQLYDGTLMELEYFLSVGTGDGKYGITVTKRTEALADVVSKYPSVSPSEAYVSKLLQALQFGTVTPIALPDVLEDLMSSDIPVA